MVLETSQTGITCKNYVPENGKRCKHFLQNGGCSLPQELMCIEWVKANPHRSNDTSVIASAKQAKATLDLFGNPLPPDKPAKPKPISHPPESEALQPTPSSAVDVDHIRGLTSDDIESFKALGVEIQLHSDRYGDLWLVPAYTNKPRKELTPEHVATLLRVAMVFPGVQVVSFDTLSNQERPERQEKRS